MLFSARDFAMLVLGFAAALTHALDNTTDANRTSNVESESETAVASPFRFHFSDCPGTHTEYCFHGTCRFIIQENIAACLCHPGYMGMRCEHADLLAVVADSQKKQTITVLVVVSVVACVLLIVACVLIHCCRLRKRCEWCRAMLCRQDKPSGLLKGGTSCCQSETVV